MDSNSDTPPAAQDIGDPDACFRPISHTPWDGMTWDGMTWLENLANFGAELTTFAAARMKEDVQTQQKLFHCKSVPEMQQVQAEFVQKAINQYYAETAKLTEIVGKSAPE